MKNNNLQRLLGIELPIIQSPMAGVQDSALAIAVSKAGGLGSLPCGMLTIDKIVREMTLIKQATTAPCNLNFFCHQMPQYNEARQIKWRSTLEHYFTELGVEIESSPQGASRVPFSHQIADAIEPFSPEVISFHFGLPERSLLQRIKGWGCKVISTATTVKEALWLEANGADAIIAQGLEAGGHRGMFLSNDLTTQLGTIALVPQIIDQVTIPVIAAGGIADRLGVEVALQLGACAAQVGTAYLLCSEATTSQLHRAAITSEQSQHTALTNIFSGKPARGIVNRSMQELGYLSADAPAFPYASIEMGQLRQRAEQQGRTDFTPLWCGQNTMGCKEVSATELTLQLAGKVL
ncbi:nitronate monooxygenase family protein [Psychrobium sp. 1_MG-2023]|uniref:NAD(P)H-dependent flavin oxidoreductase n=1 Tax=Psychrobium sp. 1_MG-2023 TaxID=3062624 RepID=UPI000C336E56|nr:nitronate monooxygenase [Psychrobium sp. 1_MG-2023]MDP2562214.1 nitronate monooxygenase [Psychrobium sp. 1_MG-2023]PKF58084.1 2-nitropropane dioxygenase [Alteromonadales bacterium alter-6D02]